MIELALKPNIDELDIVEIEVLVLDSAEYFFTCKKCNVRHNLINWVHCEKTKVWFIIVIDKFDNGFQQRMSFFLFYYTKSGVY